MPPRRSPGGAGEVGKGVALNHSHPRPRPRERGGLGRGAAPCHRWVRGEPCVSGAPSPRSRARAMSCAGRAVPSGAGHGPPRARPRLVPVHAAPRGFPAVAAAAVAVVVLPRSRARAGGPRAPDCRVSAPPPWGARLFGPRALPLAGSTVCRSGSVGRAEKGVRPASLRACGEGSGSVVPAGVSGSPPCLPLLLLLPAVPRPPPAAAAARGPCQRRPVCSPCASGLPGHPTLERPGVRLSLALLSWLTALLPG